MSLSNISCVGVLCPGWWCFIDALVVSKAVLHDSFPFTYWLPGIVATIALVLMNLVPRESLGSTQYYGDEDSDVSTSACPGLSNSTDGTQCGQRLPVASRPWIAAADMLTFRMCRLRRAAGCSSAT